MAKKSKVEKSEYGLDNLYDYSCYVECEVAEEYPCKSGKDYAGCDPYCRCRKINGGEVTKIHYDPFVDLISYPKANPIKDYCLERSLYKLLTKDSFSIFGTSGYYGDELRVSLCDNSLNELIYTLNNGTITECIEYYLKLEYGFVIPEYKNAEWLIEDVSVTDIINSYNSKMDHNKIKEYENAQKFSALCCVCSYPGSGGNKYRVIDGRHRVQAANNALENKLKEYKRGKRPDVKVQVIYCHSGQKC